MYCNLQKTIYRVLGNIGILLFGSSFIRAQRVQGKKLIWGTPGIYTEKQSRLSPEYEVTKRYVSLKIVKIGIKRR